MENRELFPLIEGFQTGNRSAFESIYDAFKKLNWFYSRRLRDEDAMQELDVCLVEVIYKIPLARFSPDDSDGLNRYIASSIRNRYIALSQKKNRWEAMTCALEDLCLADESAYEEEMTLHMALETLTQRQRHVILCKFMLGYSDAEIAAQLGVTRQAVNRLVTRGIKILREFYGLE